MNLTSVTFRPIGILRSPHTRANATPIQPVYAADCRGRAEIFPEFADGLADIEGFSHVYLLYWLHRAGPPRLRLEPFLQDVEHGVFATRAPCRPNPVGLSLVRLVRRQGHVLHLAGLDMLDGTPLLDIKPFAPRYDTVENARGGWTEQVDEVTARRRGRRGYCRGGRSQARNPATKSDPR
ncbi:MAG TPA: tRNA (N6-threonylcarbamoyladenosine(37)-N6)-methyltransferase TrmO [Opitutaceae bacterium]|nr:tRNA (N6-threonylcarbamoyladenosine(37)-N6)-methyltransferase TrmO [Opitutaceae bacterium]